ncbi:nitroreductase/quinone reductase family protein [Agromyces sp. SYSU T00194]|uniref:nitroreductase/quinone reductase family protein n=1 Tax=Agromyces chitinivorans TaxID=3158560 RepID=UPI0033970D43
MAFAPTANGTRGPHARHHGWLDRKSSEWMVRRTAAADGHAMGSDVIVMVTEGRKTGLERKTPVGWYASDDGWIVVASASGSREHPQWYRNIAAHPDHVAVETGGEHIPVDVAQLAGHERDDAWERIIETRPSFDRVRAKTDREFPILRLTRRAVP